MEKAVLVCTSCDQLMGYAYRLKSLGQVICSLSFRQDDTLWSSGEYLGMVIEDYAEAINNVLHDLYAVIEKVFNNGDISFASELRSKQNDIKQGYLGLHGNLEVIKDTITKIDCFLKNDVTEIKKIREELEIKGIEIQQQLMGKGAEKESNSKNDDRQKIPNST